MTSPPDTSARPHALAAPLPAPPVGLPCLLGDLELGEPLPRLSAAGAGRALLLVRLCTEPLGLVEVGLPAGPAEVAARVWAALSAEINQRVVAAGSDALPALGPDGVRVRGPVPWIAQRDAVLAAAPAVSVVLCTRDRADRLGPCLDRLRAQAYPEFEIVVVDNAPASDAVQRLVEACGDGRVRHTVEPRAGLSRARNTGVAVARHDVVAFVDDDESADRFWLAEIARGFAAAPGVGCVTGVILPAELQTQPQLWFEDYGGHSKGRGFRRAVTDPADRSGQSPLYPLPPFGAGGNMAFTRAALERIGGFDVAMGAGTPARGAEDTAAFTDVLLAGFRLVYQPSAMVRHTHYRTVEGLRAQMYGYGSGLGAYYMRLLTRSPALLPALVRLLPTAGRDTFGKDSIRTGHLPAGFPRELLREQRRGMLRGPVAYLRGRRAERRAAACGCGRTYSSGVDRAGTRSGCCGQGCGATGDAGLGAG